MLVPQTESYFFSSDPNSGAQNVSADGSAFSVYLDRPLGLPTNAVGATLGVISATIWNNTFNISQDIGNNVLRYFAPLAFSHVIPDGQYSVQTLLNFIQLSLIEDGFPEDSISIAGDSSTQKVILTVKANFQLDLTLDLRLILGFDSQLVPPAAPILTDTTVYAENQASFNRVDLYQIKSDIVSGGIPVNNQNNNIIASVPITAKSGSQIVYQPYNLTEVKATELVGYKKNTFRVELLDQLGRPTPTNGEIFTFVLRFKYFLKE